MANKKYTEKEKLSILKEADHKGVTIWSIPWHVLLLAEEIHVNVTNAKK